MPVVQQCTDSKPEVRALWIQARQLLTDPAVAREFERLRGVAEAKAQEVRKLQEELQAVNFSQDSKAGRLLMAKCRALQVGPSPFFLASHVMGTLLLQPTCPPDRALPLLSCSAMLWVPFCGAEACPTSERPVQSCSEVHWHG